MKILLASSEIHPFSKTGGLADMVGALGKALAQLGHEVAIITPLYSGIREKFPQMQPLDLAMRLLLDALPIEAQLWTLQPQPGLTIYFVDQPGFFQRKALYLENGKDYPDNAERFIFFSKAVVHLARHLNPDVVHVHDWQAGLVPALIRHERMRKGWGTAPLSCLTIHNLAYQGNFPRDKFRLTNLPWEYFTLDGVEFFGGLNCLKAGICYADTITTVSPRYAREITTEEYGCGLDGVLRARQSRLHGILNGVDYDEWNPEIDPLLPARFSVSEPAGKALCKEQLQTAMGLPVNPAVPVFGTVSRLADQKGVDIQLAALEEMLAADLQFVLLGSGSPEFEKAYVQLGKRHPDKVSVRIGYDNTLAHLIEAGSDFFLMPSRFEPCGLNQMYSLRYGTVPVVRATGGLDDSVTDLNENPEEADGIKFYEYSARALAKAIRKALAIHANPELLENFRLVGMQKDFSWERTCAEYLAVYQSAEA